MDYSGLYCQCFRNTSKIQTVEIVSVYHKRLKVLFAMQPLLLLSMRFKAGCPPLVLLVQRNLKKEPILVNRKFKEHVLLYCFSSFRQTFLYMWRVGEPVLQEPPGIDIFGAYSQRHQASGFIWASNAEPRTSWTNRSSVYHYAMRTITLPVVQNSLLKRLRLGRQLSLMSSQPPVKHTPDCGESRRIVTCLLTRNPLLPIIHYFI